MYTLILNVVDQNHINCSHYPRREGFVLLHVAELTLVPRKIGNKIMPLTSVGKGIEFKVSVLNVSF